VSGPFVGAMSVEPVPDELKKKFEHIIPKQPIVNEGVSLDNYWSHHRLFGIGFDEYDDKYIIYGPSALENTKPPLLNDKQCEYVSLSHMFGGASFSCLGYEKHKQEPFFAKGCSSVYVKDKLDGSMVGLSTGHTLTAPSMLPFKFDISGTTSFDPNDPESILSSTCLLYDRDTSWDDFIGYTKRGMLTDDYDIGIFDLRAGNTHILQPVKNLFDKKLLKKKSKYYISGIPDVPLSYETIIQENKFFYSPFAPHGPQYISSDLSDKNLVLCLNEPVIMQTVDKSIHDFSGWSGSVIQDEKGNQIGLLVGFVDSRCCVLPFTKSLFDEMNIETP